MPDTINAPVIDPQAFLDRWAEHEKRARALTQANKIRLCEALAACGVTHIFVRFDGCGDSGQIEDIEARAGDCPMTVPVAKAEYAQLHFGAPEPELRSVELTDAIEHLAYACLELEHSGWENSDGAFGTFTFDIAERNITLEYCERYTATENHTHIY